MKDLSLDEQAARASAAHIAALEACDAARASFDGAGSEEALRALFAADDALRVATAYLDRARRLLALRERMRARVESPPRRTKKTLEQVVREMEIKIAFYRPDLPRGQA